MVAPQCAVSRPVRPRPRRPPSSRHVPRRRHSAEQRLQHREVTGERAFPDRDGLVRPRPHRPGRHRVVEQSPDQPDDVVRGADPRPAAGRYDPGDCVLDGRSVRPDQHGASRRAPARARCGRPPAPGCRRRRPPRRARSNVRAAPSCRATRPRRPPPARSPRLSPRRRRAPPSRAPRSSVPRRPGARGGAARAAAPAAAHARTAGDGRRAAPRPLRRACCRRPAAGGLRARTRIAGRSRAARPPPTRT